MSSNLAVTIDFSITFIHKYFANMIRNYQYVVNYVNEGSGVDINSCTFPVESLRTQHTHETYFRLTP